MYLIRNIMKLYYNLYVLLEIFIINLKLFSIMKYLLLFFMLIISCDSTINSVPDEINSNEIVKKQEGFQRLVSKNTTNTAFYKVDKTMNSPVQLFTFYVTNTKSNKVVRETEKIAAERIYWKDDHTLAIVPYVGMVQQSNEVGVNDKIKEILITIK